MATIQDVLMYSDAEYNYLVLNNPKYGEPEFWTLEKTEEDAIRRVKLETEAYPDEDGNDFRFTYHRFYKEVKESCLGGGKTYIHVWYD